MNVIGVLLQKQNLSGAGKERDLMKKLKKIIVASLAFMMAFGLVGCSSDKGGSEKVLYSNGGPQEFFETPWLNPGSFMYNKVLYSRLIVADEKLNPIEGDKDALAKSYTYSADGKKLSFELRDDIFWHDGEKITAEDIKWSIEYASKTAVLNAVFKSTFSAIEGSDGGKAATFSGIKVDGNKIEITFDKVAPDALLTFTQFAPLPKKHIEGVDPLKLQQDKYFQNPVGSGPFKVEKVQMKDYASLVPFDKYYNGVAKFNITLTASPGDSDPNFVTNAKSGKLDFAYTKSVADIKALKGDDKLTTTPVNVRYTRLFYVNKFPSKKDGKESPLANEKVRQAIRYAIDMETIGKNLFDGAAIPANVLIPGDEDKATGLETYKYNPEKAKQLLAEAKWNPNTELDVVYYYTDQLTVDFMTAIQDNLKDVGVKMKFRLVEGDLATLLWKAPADQTKGPAAVDWDMCYAAVAALSLHEYYDRYRTGSLSNSHTPADAKLNDLIDATNKSPKPEEQLAAFKELSKYESTNMFSVPLYYQPVYVVTSKKVEGNVDLAKLGNPQFCYNWNIQNWELK